MVKRAQLTVGEKVDIVGAVVHGGLTKASVARRTKRNIKTISKWVSTFKVSGSLECKQGRGRKPLLDDDTCKIARQLLTNGRFAGAMEVGTELYRQGKTKVEVNRTTIIKLFDSMKKRIELCIAAEGGRIKY